MQKKDKPGKNIRKNLFDYLSHLDSEKDFPEIKRYLQSPFFKVWSRKKVIQLFDLLIRQHPDYKGNSQTTNASLNKKMKITYVANLKATLIECVEDYLRIKQVREKEDLKVLLLAESLEEMNMCKELIKYVDLNLEHFKNIEAYTENDYYLKYRLLIKKQNNLLEDRNKKNEFLLEEAINTLSYYYLYSNLTNLIANKMESRIYKRETNVSLAENMVNSVQKFHNILDPNITINYYLFKFNNSDNIETKKAIYYDVKKIVFNQWKRLNPNNRLEIYLNTINVTLSLMYDGIDFEKEQFEVHMFWIDKNVHKLYKYIDTALFMAIVVSASTVQEFEWSKNFIQENKNLLIDGEKNETLNYCKAYMNYKQKKYKDAIEILNTIRFSNPLFELNLKMLELKCLFEMKDICRFDICIKNIKNYIARHKKLSDKVKIAHLNAIKYLEKTEKARFTNNFNDLKLLRKTIMNHVELNSKVWLIKKIDEILNQ